MKQFASAKVLAISVAIIMFVVALLVGNGYLFKATNTLERFMGQEVYLLGEVEGSSTRVSERGTSFVLICQGAKLADGDKPSSCQNISGKVRIFVAGKADINKICGQVAVTGKLKPLTSFANPGGWDSELWNEIHDLQGRMSIAPSKVQIISSKQSFTEQFKNWSASLRKLLVNKTSGQIEAVLAGMTLGGYEGIDERTKLAFANVGLAHLLAVSGTHVTLLAGFLLLVLPRQSKVTLIFIALTLIGYAALCGFKPPILRALLMSLSIFGGQVYERLPQRSNIFCATIVLLLAYEPKWFWDVGFQLSFVTTAGLLYLYPIINGLCKRFVPPQLGAPMAISLTAQLAALPFLVYYFHQLSLISIVANLLLLPFFEIAVVLTLLGFLLLPLLGLGQVLFYLATSLALPLLSAVYYLADLSFATITVGQWPFLCSFIYYVLLILLFNDCNLDDFSQQERKLLVSLCCISLLVVGCYENFKPQPLTVHFMDVGEGDAALVLTPERQAILIDTGGLATDYDTGSRIVAPYLRYLGVRKLDYLILSHGHHDHAGGAAAVAKAVPIEKIILPNDEQTNEIKALLSTTQATILKEDSSANYTLGSTQITTLVAPRAYGDDANENSLIIRIASGERGIIFTGDATEELELMAAEQVKPSDVLKVSHHGSNHSSSQAFLAAVQPKVAVISVGAGNSYGHPGEETLARLTNVGAQIMRTDLEGAIKVIFDDKAVKCYSYRYQKEFF